MATIKKVVAKKPLTKAQRGGPKFKDPSPKATKDSTNYYTGKHDFYIKAAENLEKNEPQDKSIGFKARGIANDANNDRARQSLKGKPGYDANGFPVKYKKGGATKPKAQLGTIVKGIKAIGKVFNRVNNAPGGTTAIGGALATGIAAAAKGGKKPVAKKVVIKKKK